MTGRGCWGRRWKLPTEYLDARWQMSPKLGLSGVLCLRSLKIELLKGYVGGLDASASKLTHIGLLGELVQTNRPMMELKASRFVGSGYFGNLST